MIHLNLVQRLLHLITFCQYKYFIISFNCVCIGQKWINCCSQKAPSAFVLVVCNETNLNFDDERNKKHTRIHWNGKHIWLVEQPNAHIAHCQWCSMIVCILAFIVNLRTHWHFSNMRPPYFEFYVLNFQVISLIIWYFPMKWRRALHFSFCFIIFIFTIQPFFYSISKLIMSFNYEWSISEPAYCDHDPWIILVSE